MDEYSFFRAEGKTLQAIYVVNAAKAEATRLRDFLCDNFGAQSYFSREGVFCFGPEAKIPARWEIVNEHRRSGSNELLMTAAKPAESCADALMLANVDGMIQRAKKFDTLEKALGIEPLPQRILPGGNFYNAFVRRQDRNEGSDIVGNITDVTFNYGFCSATILYAAPLVVEKLDGAWYVRVPNDEQGQPRATLPDAVPVMYPDMLLADAVEYGLRKEGSRQRAEANQKSMQRRRSI